MMLRKQNEAGPFVVRETREQAARSISSALDFLRNEADAIGMIDVGELIDRARERANEYWPARKAD
ncbi:MAG TPA: hypothetical protein VFG91_09860 [Woeseiaceae bacterium]|nr:hypothetical protein [Woeseiaceae bacterium]